MNRIEKNIFVAEVLILALLLILLLFQKQKYVISVNGYGIDEKKIALTFDDGPHAMYTPVLLDGLKKRNVKATFFVIGKKAEENHELIKRMQCEGHLIGNHTFSHVQLSSVNLSVYQQEIEQTNQLLEKILEDETLFVRPPYGEWNRSLEQELNVFPVFWTIDPLDWMKTDVGEIVEAVVADATAGDIILLHDCYHSSVEAAFQIIDILQKRGFVFVTVDDILFD